MFNERSWEECKLLISDKFLTLEKRIEKLENSESMSTKDLAVLKSDAVELQKQIGKIFEKVDNIKVETAINKTKIIMYASIVSGIILILLSPITTELFKLIANK